MKKVKKEGGAGLQEWLSYQSRTREAVQPETDIIDWDEGIEVQEEWLPRELCEQRLREEAERKLAPALKSTPTPSVSATLEPSTLEPVILERVSLEYVSLEHVSLEHVSLEPATLDVLASRSADLTPEVVLDDVPLVAPVTAAASQESVAVTSIVKQFETREVSPRESNLREFRGKAATPTQFESNDLVSAVPAFHR